MWLKNIEETSIQCNLQTKQIQEYKSDTSNVKVLFNEDTGNILTLNNNIVFTKKDWCIHSEMLVHVPLCSHPNPRDVLLVGYDTKIIEQILKHSDVENITVIDIDKNISTAINEHFSSLENNNKTTIKEENIEFLSTLNENAYDVILLNSNISNAKNKQTTYENISRILKNDGIFVSIFISYWENEKAQKEILQDIGLHFKILMPYYFNTPVNNCSMGSFLFAGNKFHPTADIILHKSDLIDDLEYYNGDIHKASFCVPTNIDKAFRGFIKK